MNDKERAEMRAAAERLAAAAPPLSPDARDLIRRIFGSPFRDLITVPAPDREE